ncbi:hypothetical protein VTK56DRAFT_8941 [Thermocarpiscus australiensis]
MDGANGTLKAPKATTNGINGALKSPLNGHAVGPKRTARPSGPGMFARSFSVFARLLTWYSILTILFRCPATLDTCDDSSPYICKSYFQLKNTVVPHLEPYYDTYAAPYVQLVQPYYNAVDQKVITPGWSYAKKYGAPHLHQARAFGRAQWEKSVQPQIVKYRGLARAHYDQRLAPHISRISTAVVPYYDIVRTNTLQTYHELLLPVYQFVQPHVWEGYRATSTFANNTVVPAVVWTWNKAYVFLDGTVWPQLRAIYMENVEPQLVKIGKRLGRYSSSKKSVPKPLTDASTSSLVKTTSSFTKPAPSVTSAASSSSLPSASSAAGTTPPENARSATDSARTRAPMEPIPPPEVDEKLEREDPVRRTAREIVAADLEDWQERYTKAADEGAAEIDERVQEIARNMIRRNARITGKTLLEQLQTASVSELVSLRRAILDIVGAVNEGGVTPEEGKEQIVKAVRQAGMAVKEKAQDVRTWRENYEAEMQAAVTGAAETHFTILENIRDLALQKIGMKWAWMDGVTYKDWAKYHLLKSRFDEWKSGLADLVVNHPSLEAAQIEGANIEDEAMRVAASTAKELARLKQVANWKLVAGDVTPEFDSTLMQQAAEAVEAAKLAAASAAVTVGESAQEVKDALLDKISEGVSLAAEAVGEKPTKSHGSLTDGRVVDSNTHTQPSQTPETDESVPAQEGKGDDLAQGASRDTEGTRNQQGAESIVAASEELSSVVEPTSDATPGADATLSEDNGAASLHHSSEPYVASSMMFEEPIIVGNATEPVGEDRPHPVELPVDYSLAAEDEFPESLGSESAVPDATSSVKPAFLGAAAQSVPSRRPILENDTLDDVSSAMESVRNELKSAYSAAMSRANEQYSQALSIVSTQIHGTPQPAHEQMLASVTSMYSKAMASASSRLDDALKAASGQLYDTTTTKRMLPTTLPIPQVSGVDWSRVESIAAERLEQGRAWAEEQYESAKIAVGLATSTPSTPAEHVSKMLDNAKHNYYAGIGLAHARYSEFMAAASSALSSMTASPTPTDFAGSVSSIASVASDSAASAASAVREGASSAASAVGENVSAAAAAGYDKAAAAGDKVVEGWEVVVSQISIQVYGAPTPTPWYESIYNAASDYASSATAAAGSGAASVTSAAGAYAAAGSEEVARQYSAASSIVSELLIGKEPSFSESVLSRLSAAYATGVSSATSVAGAAQESAASVVSQAGEAAKSVGERAASAASDATEAVKDTVSHVKDEL